MENQWPDPKADAQEFQRDYFLAFGRAKAFDEIIKLMENADERARQILIKKETENAKQLASIG